MTLALALAAALQAVAPPPTADGPRERPTPPATAAAPKERPTTVESVTVTAHPGEPPKLVSSWPAQGAAVAPGTLVVKLAFDQKMSPTAWAFGGAPGQGLPRCLERPRLLNDGRTFVLLCVTTAKGSWTLRLNGGGSGFAAAGGRSLPPNDVAFTTTDETPVTALADAMKAAGLADDQGPIVNETAQAPTPTSAVTATPAPPQA